MGQRHGLRGNEAQAGRRVKDVFTLQTDITERMRELLDDPAYGAVAEVPQQNPAAHRVFKLQLAQAPRMWSTHPSNTEREENAKRAYVPAAIDERSAWEIFDNAAALRERISAELFRAPEQVQPEPEPAAETDETGETETPAQPAPVVQTLEPVPLEESRQRLNRYYRRAHLDRKYRGAYLNRSIARHAARTEELYDAAGEPAADIAGLYPEALAGEVELLRELQTERSALEALHDGFMEAPGGVIRHRGKGLKRSDLPKAIEALDAELRRCRRDWAPTIAAAAARTSPPRKCWAMAGPST